MSQEIAQDAVVERNREMLLRRSQFGINKYGVTLAGSGLTRRQLLQHALEEALDLANYIQAEIMRHDAAASEAGNEDRTHKALRYALVALRDFGATEDGEAVKLIREALG